MNQDADDSALVSRALDGDGGAFETLITRHQRALYTIACRMLGNRDEARDALQAALADLLDHSAPVLRSALGANPHLAATHVDEIDYVAPATVGGWVAFSPPSHRLDDEP